MNDFVNSEIEALDDNFLYHVTQVVLQEAKKIILVSGITILVMAACVPVPKMNHSEVLPSVEETTQLNYQPCISNKSIYFKEFSTENLIISSLFAHKGELMTTEYQDSFHKIAKVLGTLRSFDVVCRWSTIHNTVTIVQKLENGIELRSTWFAEKGGNDVVFSIFHNGYEIITSRSDVKYLVEQINDMVEKSKSYV